MAALEKYVRPKKNKRMARFRIQQRKQLDGETFDNFVKDLKLLAMDCDFPDKDDTLIDLIISGVRHQKIQERLLDQGPDVTLKKAIDIGQQYELSQAQVKFMRGEEVLKVQTGKQKAEVKQKHEAKPKRAPYLIRDQGHSSEHSSDCRNCGIKHERGKCPAIGSRCNYCKKPNHWKKMCRKRNRNIDILQSDTNSDTDGEELLTINTNTEIGSVQEDKWVTELKIENPHGGEQSVRFRIDTGAKTSILTSSQAKQIKGLKLLNSTKTLKSFSNHKIIPIGATNLPVCNDLHRQVVHFEVVDMEQENIISGDAAVLLGLLHIRPESPISSLSMSGDTSEEELSRDFPELVKTNGTLPGEYSISVDESVKGVIHPVRKLPAAIKPKAIEKLKEMERDGYIVRVDQPTEWVSSMVVSVKGDKVRICIDPRDLNKAIRREHHPMKTIEEVILDIPNAKFFSVLDAKSGFLQVKLDGRSSYLTTFNTPIGRFRWLRLPFGIKSSPEIYQKIMDDMIAGISGAFAIIDDILIAGETVEEHDKILKQVVERATSYNLKLNFNKCKIRKTQVPYIGHIISDKGLMADPEKVKAIVDMPPPMDKEGVRRFLGLVQYLSKFIPNLSEMDTPLRTLLKSDVEFEWSFEQEQSFRKLKSVCSQPPVLALYDVNKSVQIECDSSKDGLGAVIVQEGRVVAYASRSLTDTEKRYAQIEKEMLAIVFSCRKFHNYIFGKDVTVYSDHKPLETLFRKPLLSAPMRIQKMMIKLQWYDLNVVYKKGKDMHISDALSRAFLTDISVAEDMERAEMIHMLSVSPSKYMDLQVATRAELKTLIDTIQSGWPDTRSETLVEARPYFDSRDQLAVLDSIVYKGNRIVIPSSMRKDMLELVHKSHLGIAKSKSRAREVMYWPGMNADIEETVSKCSTCAEYQTKQTSEPLKPTPTPELPYSHVGSDIFEFESKKYLVLVDYYSKYIDTVELRSETTSSVIDAMKTVFSCHGIPTTLRSDNGPQFSSGEFKRFCSDNDIKHETSSPHFQSSNGEAERAVQTVKHLWLKSVDKQFALLDYRTTPLDGLNLSPAQLLMGRRPRNALPASQELLKPSSFESKKVKQHLDAQKAKQKFYYDKRKGVKELPPLENGSQIRMRTPGSKTLAQGTVVRKYDKFVPRSYVVESNGRLYRRNRSHLHVSNEGQCEIQPPAEVECEDQCEAKQGDLQIQKAPQIPSSTPEYRTKSGRQVKAPERLDL